MSSTIDLGIDLGTTNSAIARFSRGDVEVYKNPGDYGRSTLPSVVGFKKDRIFIGSKARELVERSPENVFGAFKRKMGTSETFQVPALSRSVSPVELSAHVLKELKGFLPAGETVDAAVITIPASFDTIQSNATKEAGYQAGFKQVVLLQEPIAASLAYANKGKGEQLSEGQWLVYDLGGGTFDVALVRIQAGEMKVLDHEGDNYLGGIDFDQLIVEEVIFPHLESRYSFSDLGGIMRGRSGRLNGKYQALLTFAERAKITLSSTTSAEIEVEGFDDDDGEEVVETVTVTRSDFERLLQSHIDRSVEMVRAVLTRNNLSARDLQFVLMVGGSTYMPYVRSRVGEVLGVPVNTDVDPTTAVAIGAAHFAASKPRQVEAVEAQTATPSRLHVKLAYHKASQDSTELLAAKFEGDLTGLQYRVTRDDAGFDTGFRPLQPQVVEDLPLVPNAYNFFTVSVTDAVGNPVETDIETVGIAHGKYAVAGQPLPQGIAIVRDDWQSTDRLDIVQDPIFRKNEVLPAKRTRTFSLNRTVTKGTDEALHIRVVEGPEGAHPDSNQTLGHIVLTGRKLSRDAVKGSDIEITLEMSESRDLSVSAYLPMTDQEFTEVFNPKQRSTPKDFLTMQVRRLHETLSREAEEAVEREDYEAAQGLRPLQKEVGDLLEQAEGLVSDDVTDARYQLEDRARSISQRMDEALSGKKLQEAAREFEEEKELCFGVIDAHGNDQERRLANAVVAQEAAFLSSNNPARIREKTDELKSIRLTIMRRTPEFLMRTFAWLSQNTTRMNDQEQARTLVGGGRYAIEAEDWDRLRDANRQLFNLLPQQTQEEQQSLIGF